METKGFTLVELLAVIIILSLLALITSTAITKTVKDAKGDLTNVQKNLIVEAAKTWGAENLTELPDSGDCIYITLGDLKKYGLLESNVVNFDTNDEIPDSTKIKISASSDSYKPIYDYEINPESVASCEQFKMFYTVYRNTTDVIGIGESIKPGTKSGWCLYNSNTNWESCGGDGITGWEEDECLSRLSGYGSSTTCREKTFQTGLFPGSYYTEDEKEDITSAVYLKLEIGNGVVTDAYSCIKYTENSIPKEVCFRGGEPKYYGTYDGISNVQRDSVSDKNPTGNIALIESMRGYISSGNSSYCGFSSTGAFCHNTSYLIYASNNGQTETSDVNISCQVNSHGFTYCGSSTLF